jgi:hypothetical protein
MLVLCPGAFVNAFLFYEKEQGGVLEEVKISKYLRIGCWAVV